jgi:hypothetical protein
VSPSYRIGDQTFRRKNLWLPCALGADLDAMSEDEQVRVYRATRWLDNITDAEWPAVLGEPVKSYTRSRLKRKAVGWLMALSRIALLNPALFVEVLDAAAELYREQITDRGGGGAAIRWDVIADTCRNVWAERLQTVGNEEEAAS